MSGEKKKKFMFVWKIILGGLFFFNGNREKEMNGRRVKEWGEKIFWERERESIT